MPTLMRRSVNAGKRRCVLMRKVQYMLATETSLLHQHCVALPLNCYERKSQPLCRTILHPLLMPFKHRTHHLLSHRFQVRCTDFYHFNTNVNLTYNTCFTISNASLSVSC